MCLKWKWKKSSVFSVEKKNETLATKKNSNYDLDSKKVIKKVGEEIKNPLDGLTDDFIESDEEDITTFRNLLKVTDKPQIENKTKNQIIVKNK